MNILAFDIGASSGRVIVGRFDDGKLTMQEVYRFANETVKVEGHLFWDISRMFSEMETGLKKAIDEYQIESLGIDTWGVDGAFIDANGNLCENPCGYRDFSTKNMQECIQLFGAKRLYTITGTQFLPFNTIFQFYRHKKERNSCLNNTRRFLFISDYLRYLFTGRMDTEFTIASTSQLLDARTRTWSSEIFERLEVSQEIMGPVIEPGTSCGYVRGTKLKAIAVAGHDTGSAVLSIPATDGDVEWAWMSSGTWSIMGCESDAPITTDKAREKGFSNEGGAFGRIRFLKNIMGLWITQECSRIWALEGKEYSYAELDQMVKETPPNGPIFDAHDFRFMAPENMITEIQAACRETGQEAPQTPGEIQRCILESLAKSYAVTLDELSTVTGRTFKHLHMVGGGIQNKILNQMTADACKIPVVAGPVEGSSIGNAAMQLVANGELSTISEVRRLVKESFPTKTYLPRA